MEIVIRSTFTKDVKIAQKALENIGFITLKEEDYYETYWVKMEVPEKYAHIDVNIKDMKGKERRIIT